MKFKTFSDPKFYPPDNSVKGNGAKRFSKDLRLPVGEREGHPTLSRSMRYSKERASGQSVILELPALWSRLFVWLLVGATTSALIWAFCTHLDQTVVATGKLEPKGAVKEIKAPIGGVVREIRVEDGEVVKKNQVLLTFDPTAPEADLESLTKLRAVLEQENQFYNAAVTGKILGSGGSDLVSLTKLRAALSAENQFYQAIDNGLNPQGGVDKEFNATQQRLLAASRAEIQSRAQAARLQVAELEKQFSQTQSQLITAKQVLALNQGTLNRIEPLAKQEGAISRLQYEHQQQEVLTREAEVNQLTSEQQRLLIAISEAREQLQNTIALSTKDILTKIADNQKQIAEIDTQLSRARLENKKKIAEIDAQLSKAKQAVKYQELRTPVNGVVFNLQPPASGFVASTAQTLLTIVPDSNLVASVFLTNRDIGFVREGMNVNVRIDSFPSTEFGSIKGKLVWVGSDALPPTQERPFYAFPAKIHLNSQSLMVNGRQIPLQSGMAVNCSMLVRKRPVLSIMTDLFDKQVKSIESIR